MAQVAITPKKPYDPGWAYDCLWDVPFQILKIKCIKNWTTQSGAETNIVRLLKYVGRAEGTYWRYVRIWRVSNAIHAAKKSLDERELTGPSRVCARAIAGLNREWLKWDAALWRERNPSGHAVHTPRNSTNGIRARGPFREWDWNLTKRQLVKLWETNPGMFDTLQRHYEGKVYGNPNPDYSRMRMDPRLAHFVRLMRDVRYDMEAAVPPSEE